MPPHPHRDEGNEDDHGQGRPEQRPGARDRRGHRGVDPVEAAGDP
jgi:hypothetical protein